MNGAEVLLATLTANGVRVCFMNPGTSEMQFVSALDRVPAMRGILCLHESVCSGAADGYARMLHKPAATLLHLGPGLANAISNFHNARKARSPIVNIVGEHATHHLAYDAPLTADIAAIAAPVSHWVSTLDAATAMGNAVADAIRAATTPPGRIATLIVPADHSWLEAGAPGGLVEPTAPSAVAPERVAEIARLLRDSRKAALLLSGAALLEPSLRSADRIRAATGASVFANRYAGRVTRGGGVPAAPRIPYFPEPAQALLEGIEDIVTVHAAPPVSFFGYPTTRSTLAPPSCRFHTLAGEDEDAQAALAALALQFSASAPACDAGELAAFDAAEPLTPDSIGRVLAALLPDDAIVSDEMVSSGEDVNARLARAARHDLLPVTGGSIGQGLPVALGAAIACPDRRVVALEADGSALYSLQALWTMARERCDVTVVVFANRRYRILDVEMRRTGAGPIGPKADEMLDLRNPTLDFATLARGHGVDAVSVQNAGGLATAFAQSLRRKGPFLIEAVME